MNIRPAHREDLPSIQAVLKAARGIMRSSGNLQQWTDEYPSETVVLQDIVIGVGYVVLYEGLVAGYFAMLPSPDPTYARIYGGEWLDDKLPYHVIHRIGSLPEVHGVFAAIMDYAFSVDRNIRIDTHRDNHIMQHGLTRYGFSYCGIIYLASGDERLAYQRIDPVL